MRRFRLGRHHPIVTTQRRRERRGTKEKKE
jgi:hypothetical protein